MQNDDDRADKYDGGGRIVARIPFNSGPNADEVWRLYKSECEAGLFDDAPAMPQPRLYSVKRRGGYHLYASFDYYSED